MDNRCRDAGWAGIQALIARINDQGEVADVSAGTSVGRDLQHYLDIRVRQRAYGQSLAMLALGEALAHLNG
ncbi:hypothetical protein CEW81_21505 [Kluyvera genomosp. 3]|uniref:Uncharacterized protein n=1 Tax=Kluyvera genomosp. 3 TaxID=2774055 RepID=A0A248KK12_9ENTR|nr:hypothetical protein CEW81_21505 [Kluyvera genomosp. 3]